MCSPKAFQGSCRRTLPLSKVAYSKPVAQGQGYRAPSDLQLADVREGASRCCVVRPLRHISRKELTLQAHFRQLPFRAMPRLHSANRTTVNSLCNAFVADLHVRAP